MRFRLPFLVLLVCVLSLAAAATASAAPSWSPQFQLSTGDSDVFDHHLVTDSAGNTTAIWNEGGSLRARTRTQTGSFGPTVDVAPLDTVDDFDAAVDAAGNITVGYISDDEVSVTRSAGGASWSSPQTFGASDDVTSPAVVSVAADPAGTAVVGWAEDNDNSGSAVRKDPGDTDFSTPDQFKSDGSSLVNELTMAVRSDGRAFAAWEADEVVASNWTDTADWDDTQSQTLSDDPGQDVQLLTNGSGDVVAIWDESGADDTVQLRKYGTTEFDSPHTVSDPADIAFLPYGALDDAGNITLAWSAPGSFPDVDVVARTGNIASLTFDPFRTIVDNSGVIGNVSVSKRAGSTLVAVGTGSALIGPDTIEVFSQAGSSFSAPTIIGATGGFCSCTTGQLVSLNSATGATATWPNDDGSTTFLDAAILTDIPVPPPPPADLVPQIISAKLSSLKFRAASSGASVAKASRAPKGTALTVNANKAGTLNIDIQKYTTGKRPSRSSKCSSKAKKGKGCTIWKTIDSNMKTGKAGVNTFKVSGRVGGKKLKPGQYRVVIALKSGDRTSAPKTRTFKIVK